jgi:hypothetical protein
VLRLRSPPPCCRSPPRPPCTALPLSVADIIGEYAVDICPHCEKEVDFLYSCVYDKCQEPGHRVCVPCLKRRNEGGTIPPERFNFEGGRIVGNKIHFEMNDGGGGDHPWADHCFACHKQVDEGSSFCWVHQEVDLDPKILAMGCCGRGWCHACHSKAFGCRVGEDDGTNEFKCKDCATPEELESGLGQWRIEEPEV